MKCRSHTPRKGTGDLSIRDTDSPAEPLLKRLCLSIKPEIIMESLESFLQIGIVGAFLAAVVQVIKIKFGTTGTVTKLLTVALALVIASAYYFLQGTEILTAFVQILAIASTIYAFLLK